MTEDKKISYFLYRYNLSTSCLCKKCGSEVIKSPRKNFDFYCFKCKELLFNDEVNCSTIKKTQKDVEGLKNVMKKYGVEI